MKKRIKNYRKPNKKAIKLKKNEPVECKMEQSDSFDFDKAPPAIVPDSGYHTRQQSDVENFIIIQQPVGLQNPGWNCCYLNSILQLLRSVKELVDFFLNGDAALVYSGKNNVAIAVEFHNLLRAWNGNENLDEIHRIFRQKCGEFNPEWSNGRQQDAPHFLLFLLEKLDTDLLLEDGTSLIQQLFQGKMCYNRRCKECDRVHSNEASFQSLDLSLIDAAPGSTVSDLVSIFTARIDDGDKSLCDNCQVNVDTDTRIRITLYPKVLLVCLKRYIADEYLNIIKLTSEVNFDTIIIPDGRNYNIKSFVSHYGETLNSGHYTASVSFGGKFVEYSDKSIDVKDTVVSSQECYLLAYQALPQDNLLILAEFQWLEKRRIAIERNQLSDRPLWLYLLTHWCGATLYQLYRQYIQLQRDLND
jgi:ubiquitin C-terminal hydrolase